MTITEPAMNLRPYGQALLITIIIFMFGAYSAAYFRPPLPTTPLEQLQRIANDRLGWTAQAIIFPIMSYILLLVLAVGLMRVG